MTATEAAKRQADHENLIRELVQSLTEAERFVDRHSEPWYLSGQELRRRMLATISKAREQGYA